MKRLLTLSALLLFSVDVFADEEYCVVSGDRYVLEREVIERCDKGEIIYASIDESIARGRHVANNLVLKFCDFEKQIIINSGKVDTKEGTTLLCVMNSNKARQSN